MPDLRIKALFTLSIWASGLLSSALGASATPEVEADDSPRVPIPQSAVSAHADTFSSHVAATYPLIQSWIDHPQASAATAANDAIHKVIPEANIIVSSLGGDTGKECSNQRKRGSKRSKITTFPDAVRCISEGLEDISSAIEHSNTEGSPASKTNGVASQLDDLKPEVEDLKNTKNKLGSRADAKETTPKELICNSKCSACKSTSLDVKLSDFEEESELCSRSIDEDDINTDITEHGKRELSEEGGKTENEVNELATRGLEEDKNENTSQDLTKRGLKLPPNAKRTFAPWYLSQFKNSYNVPHGAPASAIVSAFQEKQVKMGVVNLYGCTSVIIASKYGAYVSHFWEAPSFLLQENKKAPWHFDQAQFTNDVLNTLGSGCKWIEKDGFKGDYFFRTEVGSICQPAFYADDADTQVIIVTPWLPAQPTIKYPNQVSQIKQHIKQLLPNAAEAQVAGYFNIGESDRRITNERFVDNGRFTFGKVLLNWEPASRTKMDAHGNLEMHSELEIWVGDRINGKPVFTHSWPATSAQLGCE